MARTLWPAHSIVCIKDLHDFPYRLVDRVVEDQKCIIAIYSLQTFKIEWAFLEDLEYLDKPENFEEYLHERPKSTKRTVRKTKGTSYIYRTGSIEEYQRK